MSDNAAIMRNCSGYTLILLEDAGYIDLGRLSEAAYTILSVYISSKLSRAFSTFDFFVGFRFIVLFPITDIELLLEVEMKSCFISGILVASLVKQCPNQLMSLLKSWQLLDG